MRPLELADVRTGLGLQEEIVRIACPQTVGETIFGMREWDGCRFAYRCCFCPFCPILRSHRAPLGRSHAFS